MVIMASKDLSAERWSNHTWLHNWMKLYYIIKDMSKAAHQIKTFILNIYK